MIRGLQEILNLRNEVSKTYALGGRKRRCVISGAVHYKDDYADKSELWKDIDLTFVDGRITKTPYILEVKELSITLTSKKTGTVQSLALERIGSEKSKRPVPWEFTGNQATWKNAAPQTDIVIEAGADLVRLKRILHSTSAPLEAAFTHSKVVGKADDILLHISARDADGEALEIVKTDDDGKLTESIDSKIDLSKVKFPIEIDPTLTIQPPAKDNYLIEHMPDTNLGTDTILALRDRVDYIYRIILEFDISELPAGATLISASLGIYFYYGKGTALTGKTAWAYKLTHTDWVETESTWNIYKTGSNWTAAGGDYVTSDPSGGSTTFPADYAWVTWNVLAIVQDAYDGEVAAEFLVKFETEGLASGDSLPQFHSKEYTDNLALRPKLVIDYTVAVEHEKTLTESLGLVDKVVKAPALLKTEPLGLLDTYSRTWVAHKTYSELLGLADVVSKGVVQHPLTETLGLSDTVVKEPGKMLEESLGLLDVYSKTWSVYRTYTELLGLLDTVTKDVSLPLSEILGLLDTYNRVWTAHKTFTETLGLEDRVSKHISLHALTEVLGLLDSISYGRNLTILAKLIRKYIQLENIGGGGQN